MHYYEARRLSALSTDFLDKRKVYETLDAEAGVISRTQSGAYDYIHTVYRNSLNQEDFRKLLVHIKQHFLEDTGCIDAPTYQVERVPLALTSVYIFKISWRE